MLTPYMKAFMWMFKTVKTSHCLSVTQQGPTLKLRQIDFEECTSCLV